MNITEQMDAIEATPLLGAQRISALEGLDTLSLRIDPDRNPRLALRLLIRRFQAMPVTNTTLAQLSTAEAWASKEGLDYEQTRIQLIWCTSVGRSFPEAVPRPILNRAVEHAKALGTLEAEWRLALATTEPEHASDLRISALKILPSPSEDATRIQTLLDLADDQHRGSDALAAFKTLRTAVDLSTEHADPKAMCTSLLRLGFALLEQGRNHAALPPLQRAFDIALSEEDDLSTIKAGSPLSAILLDAEQWELAGTIADRLLIAGARRANWFAVVDAHITRSAISLAHDDPTSAIDRLVRAAVHLRELIPAAAINLIKGRLAELRHELGASVFDEHYRNAVQSHQQDSPT